MRKIYLFLIFLICSLGFSQTPPELISFRATALDASNQIVSSQNIAVKFSILQNSVTGTAIYEETHLTFTDTNGSYNLQIGGGTQITGNFENISWDVESKFLKLEIDTNGGNNFVQVGQPTQLLTVPYAFLAKKAVSADNGLTVLNNINELRNLSVILPQDHNKIVYIKGYYEEGDGGDGIFMFNKDEITADVGGIHIKPNSISGDTGRWVRQYSGYINAIYFGIVKFPNYNTPFPVLGSQSNSDRIQAAINYVSLTGSNVPPHYSVQKGDLTLYFPDGHYYIDKTLILKNELHIKGNQGTLFEVMFGSNYDYMFKLSEGSVTRLTVENLLIDLAASRTNNTGGFHIKALSNSNNPNNLYGGGVWGASFKNIKIISSSGHGIYLQGDMGSTPYGALDNQYMIFERVWIVRNNSDKNCLKIEGATNTTTFINCQFEIPYQYDTPNSQEQGDPGTNINISGITVPHTSSNLTFLNCATGGHVQYGVKLSGVENVTFDSCWFEDTDFAIFVKDSKAVNLLNNRFANAAGRGSLPNPIIGEQKGSCISVENSFVNVERNYTLVTDPNSSLIKNELFINGIGENNVINSRDNSFQDIRLSYTYGIVQYINIQNVKTYYPSGIMVSGIDCDGKKTVLVKPSSSNTINRINSTISAGETIFIRAENGDITFSSYNPVNETTGKNIYLSGLQSLTLKTGQTAVFIKLDGVNNNEKSCYQLVSKTN